MTDERQWNFEPPPVRIICLLRNTIFTALRLEDCMRCPHAIMPYAVLLWNMIFIGKCYDDCPIKQHAAPHSLFLILHGLSYSLLYHWIFNINVLVVTSAVWCVRWVGFVSLLLTPRAPCGTTAGALQRAAPSLTGSLESEAMFSKLWINLWLQYQVVFLGKKFL